MLETVELCAVRLPFCSFRASVCNLFVCGSCSRISSLVILPLFFLSSSDEPTLNDDARKHNLNYRLIVLGVSNQIFTKFTFGTLSLSTVFFSVRLFFFSFHVEYIFVSFPVILFITGEAAPAALPAHARWAAFPLQTLLHREHLRGRMPASGSHATPLSQSQVLIHLHKLSITLKSPVGATRTLMRVPSPFQPWKISIVLRPWDYYDESRLQRAVSQGKFAAPATEH